MESTQSQLASYSSTEVSFAMFFPEAHLLGAAGALKPGANLGIGCQGVHPCDTQPGGNFGAFTTARTANSMVEAGCSHTIIGHCEERGNLNSVLQEVGVSDAGAVARILNREILAAQKAGLSVLYCVGERAEEQDDWQAVLGHQLDMGLKDVGRNSICIAYEPVWSIGPGKTPPNQEYITRIARFIKERTGGLPVVYGGGLKRDNAAMLSAIEEIDGGLIALTRFSGEIGFYPQEYLEIVREYLGKAKATQSQPAQLDVT